VSDSNTTKAITPAGILSYPHFHKPQEAKDGKAPKYSCAIVFEAGTDLSGLKAAALAALKDKFGDKIKVGPKGKEVAVPVEQAFENGIRSPFRTDAAAKGYPAGSTFINVRTARQPGFVTAQAGPDGKPAKVAPEKVKDTFYPGAIVRASVAAFYYDTEGNKGISFALNNVQFLRDGERLDSQVDASDEFEADLSQPPADLAELR
jgi:hypothetical protein